MLSNTDMNYTFAMIDISLDIFNWDFLQNVLSRLNFKRELLCRDDAKQQVPQSTILLAFL